MTSPLVLIAEPKVQPDVPAVVGSRRVPRVLRRHPSTSQSSGREISVWAACNVCPARLQLYIRACNRAEPSPPTREAIGRQL